MAEPGELEPWFNPRTKRKEWRLVLPERCANGHTLKAGTIHLSHVGCRCNNWAGHTIVTCLICDDRRLIPVCEHDEAPRL